MELIIRFGKWLADIMDYVFGWMLHLSDWFGLPEQVGRDIAIFIVAIGTSVILTYARKWTTDQDLMERCKNDLKQLKKVRKRFGKKDKEAKRNIQATTATINLKRLKAEGWGLLASLIPIALLATWAWERLDYFPPEPGQTLTLRANFAVADVDELTWLTMEPADAPVKVTMGLRQLATQKTVTENDKAVLRWVPEPDVPGEELAARGRKLTGLPTTAPDGDTPLPMPTAKVQPIRHDDAWDVIARQHVEAAPQAGLAVWEITPTEPVDVKLVIGYPEGRMEHQLKVGYAQYAQPLIIHDMEKGYMTYIDHRRAGFLNWIPGVDWFWNWWNRQWYTAFFPPWLVAYLVICIPFVPLLRMALKVY